MSASWPPRALGVEVQLRYFPLHLIPEWRARGHRLGECPVAERLWFEQQINLPCHPGLSDEQVDYLVSSVRAALASARQDCLQPGVPPRQWGIGGQAG
jgi:perosamine synthetase